jgi:hypothetical protein
VAQEVGPAFKPHIKTKQTNKKKKTSKKPYRGNIVKVLTHSEMNAAFFN